MGSLVTRRSALGILGALAGVFAVGGAAVGSEALVARTPQLKALAHAESSGILRPPGGQDETRLLALCLKCNRCISVCPQGCIVTVSSSESVLAARTPQLNFHRGYCDFCQDENDGVPLCEQLCPTGALASFDWNDDKIGIAVIDHDECLAFHGMCNQCKGSCAYEALLWDDLNRPYIDQDKCNGCGECVNACNVNVAGKFGGSRMRAVEVKALGVTRGTQR